MHNMGRPRKFDYQAAIVGSLAAHPDGLTLDQLLERSGFEVDRSTLFRHLTRLMQSGSVVRTGQARASRYRSLGVPETGAEPPAPLAPIPALPSTGFRPAAPPGTEPQSAPERRLAVSAPAHRPVAAGLRPAQADPGPNPAPVLPPGYEMVVKKAVRTAVRDWKRYDRANLHIYVSLLAKAEHRDALAAVVEAALAGLHEGNLAEYDLSPAEFSRFVPAAPTGSRAAGKE